jgi:hypothetical protein
VTPEQLADHWMIGLETARQTHCYYPVDTKRDRMYRVPRLQGEWYTDTVEGRCKSRDSKKYGRIYANDAYFAVLYPMDAKSKAGDALHAFCREYGAPDKLRFDGSKEQTGKNTEFQRQIRKHNIQQHVSEPNMHNQSPAEGSLERLERNGTGLCSRRTYLKYLGLWPTMGMRDDVKNP